jgi:phosphoribosylanthranilate isomerase
MTAVKICGITNGKDAFTACDCGADALGFIFYEPSPRYLKPEEVKKIVANLPGNVGRVGVFVNPEISLVHKIREYCRLDFIQLCGDESPDFCSQIPSSALLKVVSAAHELDRLNLYRTRAFLIDFRQAGQFGGTGRLSNWELAKTISKKYSVILAGGLNPENVEAAIKAVSPAAVDVNSGVEISPGKKDLQKVRLFIERVRGRRAKGKNGIFSREKIDQQREKTF